VAPTCAILDVVGGGRRGSSTLCYVHQTNDHIQKRAGGKGIGDKIDEIGTVASISRDGGLASAGNGARMLVNR
jgi:hypothetical protein